MSNRIKDNTVGPWAKDKLESLERGLDYYTTRLKKTDYWQKIYIDAFAGPGLSEVRSKPKDPEERLPDLFAGEIEKDPVEQEVEYLRGSPRVALELKNPFDRYIFIEKDPKRIAELLAMKAEYDGRRYIEVRPGDANAVLQELLRSGIRKRSHRAFAFLDPFGLQMPWETIEALAATEAVEVMINFPMGMAIRRMMPKSGDVPPDWHISLTTFFGTDEWRKYAYEEVTDLAGPRTRKFADSETRLMEWYRERLRWPSATSPRRN